jgi:plasmid stabilization system protein ParE
MGNPSPDAENERHWFLRRSRFHVYYELLARTEEILVVRIRHEKQRSLKR